MKSFGEWFNDFGKEEPKEEKKEVTKNEEEPVIGKKYILDDFGETIEVDYEATDYISVEYDNDFFNPGGTDDE